MAYWRGVKVGSGEWEGVTGNAAQNVPMEDRGPLQWQEILEGGQ